MKSLTSRWILKKNREKYKEREKRREEQSEKEKEKKREEKRHVFVPRAVFRIFSSSWFPPSGSFLGTISCCLTLEVYRVLESQSVNAHKLTLPLSSPSLLRPVHI